ncbi:TonB family protein [Sorangium sp. So ce385]|uniref:TonB family protein n=1 Tax=Sorangium sp. So ce385 TaxID=3133308 RepID=UPI003F5C6C3B
MTFRPSLKLATFLLLTACGSEIPPSATPTAIRHRQNIEPWRSAQALSDAYVPEVRAGNLAALGKIRHVPFALYINSMHERIHSVYEEELAAAREAYPELRGEADMAVLLEIAVNQGDGRLARLGVASSSGSVAFDVVALEAVRRAAPFDAPPQLLVSPGGKVYLHWMFHTDPYQACATFNARPFMLASAPAAAAAGQQPVPGHLTGQDRSAPMAGAAQQGAARRPPSTRFRWACPFPDEADKNGIDTASVVLQASVGIDGSARSVTVLHDPGNGFGQAAAACAMRKDYTPGKDRPGAPIVATTPPITVQFVRGEATTASIPGAVQLEAARQPLSGSSKWACPFPEEADKNAIDRGTAVIKVYVEPDGSARWAQVLHDSGYGFGSAAAQCAMGRRYIPAKASSGAPVAAWTPPITVNFIR